MSEENTQKQAVVDDTDASPKAGAEEQVSAPDGDDLDKLLSEYDEELAAKAEEDVSKPEPKKAKGGEDLNASKELLTELKQIREERESRQKAEHAREFRADMDNLVGQVRADLDAELFDNEFVEDWIERAAKKDERLRQAWIDRKANPQRFSRISQQLAKEFAKYTEKFSKRPDQDATEDREAVANAVRGASTKAPEPKPTDYSGLSNAEFRNKVAKDHGIVPPV